VSFEGLIKHLEKEDHETSGNPRRLGSFLRENLEWISTDPDLRIIGYEAHIYSHLQNQAELSHSHGEK